MARIIYIVALAAALFLMFQTTAQAAVCKLKIDNSATIVGKGRTPQAALEDAAEQCFDKRKSEIGGSRMSEDTALEIIDECGNISCQI